MTTAALTYHQSQSKALAAAELILSARPSAVLHIHFAPDSAWRFSLGFDAEVDGREALDTIYGPSAELPAQAA